MFASVEFITFQAIVFSQDSYVLDRGQPVDWNIPYSGQPEALPPSEPEGVCHGQTDRLFLLLLNMC